MSLSTATARPQFPRPSEQSGIRFQNKVKDVRAAFADQPTSMPDTIRNFQSVVNSVLGGIEPQTGITQAGLKAAILESSGDHRSAIEPKIDELMKLITTSANASKTFSHADLEKFNRKVQRSLDQESSAGAVATPLAPVSTETHQIRDLLARVSQTIISNSDTVESKAASSEASVAASRLTSFVVRLNAKLTGPELYTSIDIAKTEKALRAVQAHMDGSSALDSAKLQKHLGVLVAVDATASE